MESFPLSVGAALTDSAILSITLEELKRSCHIFVTWAITFRCSRSCPPPISTSEATHVALGSTAAASAPTTRRPRACLVAPQLLRRELLAFAVFRGPQEAERLRRGSRLQGTGQPIGREHLVCARLMRTRNSSMDPYCLLYNTLSLNMLLSVGDVLWMLTRNWV